MQHDWPLFWPFEMIIKNLNNMTRTAEFEHLDGQRSHNFCPSLFLVLKIFLKN